MIKSRTIFLYIGFLACLASYGQLIEQSPVNQANASQSLEMGFYAEAVRQYKELLDKKPNNIELQYKLGIAYTNSFINQKKGLELLQQVYAGNNKPEGIEKELAIAFFKNYRFNEAKALFQEFLGKVETPELKAEIEKWIKQCDSSTKLFKRPVPVLFENLGKNINSTAPDYIPLVSADESLIIFSTRREGVVGNLFDYGGYRTADIYLAKHKSNKYTRSRSIGSPNTYGNEETAGISNNGKYMIYHVDSDDSYSDLFVSEKGRRSYMPPKDFGSNVVNQKSSNETGASLSDDGKTLYFSSNRDDGLGGYDIYSVKRLPNGIWAEPENLGAPINTSGDEKFPFIKNKGSELYFSSNGHSGLGGLDLFKAAYTENKWTNPVNLGYPINTVNDDQSICYSQNPRYAYISAKRDDSFGDLDIYRITFLDEKEELCMIKGVLAKPDSSAIKEKILIEILNLETGDLAGAYYSNTSTGHFIALLPPGNYSAEIFDAENYEDFSTEFKINDKKDFKPNLSIHMVLKPKPIVTPPKKEPAIEE